MSPTELKERTKMFALRVIRVVNSLPQNRTADVVGKQLLRCGTSVGANYRAACRARSTADFVSKMGIVLEETDEAAYWMELLVDAGLVRGGRMADLHDEACQLVAIIVSSINTAKHRRS